MLDGSEEAVADLEEEEATGIENRLRDRSTPCYPT